MDYFTMILPYFFKYDSAEIHFTGEYKFEIWVRNTMMEEVILPRPAILEEEL